MCVHMYMHVSKGIMHTVNPLCKQWEISSIMSEFENTDRENSHSHSATLATMGTMLYVSNDVETWTQTSVKRGAMGDRQ